MKLTNRNGYPDVITKAIENDPYSKGESDFSATGLISPPRIRILLERYKDQLETDVDDHIWKLFGQIGHGLLERAGEGLAERITERRFFATIGGCRISAQIDSLSLSHDGTLIDWKYTSVYGFKDSKTPKWEWEAQMNIQLELLRRSGLDAKKLQIWGILRDWRPAELEASKRLGTPKEKEGDWKFKGYPETKLAHHDIPIQDRAIVTKYIEQRIAAHRAAEKKLPLCTQEENWYGRRCKGYCDVANFCEQYKNSKRSRS